MGQTTVHRLKKNSLNTTLQRQIPQGSSVSTKEKQKSKGLSVAGIFWAPTAGLQITVHHWTL